MLDYATRVQRFALDIDPSTGRISRFHVKKTVEFTDPRGLLFGTPDRPALNGLNPLLLNGSASILGRSFDPEGLAIAPDRKKAVCRPSRSADQRARTRNTKMARLSAFTSSGASEPTSLLRRLLGTAVN